MEWLTIPACPSLMCSFNRGNIEGTNYSKFVFDVCLCMFCACEVIGFCGLWTKGLDIIYEKSFEMCVCL